MRRYSYEASLITHMISIIEAEDQADALEEILLENNIKILPGSPLEEACLSIKDWRLKHEKKESIDPSFDFRNQDRQIVGINFFCAKVITVHKLGRLRPFINHLKLLAKGEPTQTVPHLHDDSSNKIFELIVGLCCAELTEDVDMESQGPDKDPNPDVIARFDREKWGFACKVLHSKNPLTMYDRLMDGVRQLEKSNIDIGIVVFNLKNIFDHDEIFPRIVDESGQPQFLAHKKPELVDQKLAQFCEETVIGMVDRVGKDMVRESFKLTKTPPVCLAYLQSTASVIKNRLPVITGFSCAVDVTLTGQKLTMPLTRLQALERRLVSRDRVMTGTSNVLLASATQLRQIGIDV